MAKKRSRKQTTHTRSASTRRRAIVVIGLMLALLAGSGSLAYIRKAQTRRQSATPQSTVTPQSVNLSKEYIYEGGGGRLLATEEPTGCNYPLSSNTTTIGPGAGNGSFSVNTQANCPWSASDTDNWVTLTPPTSGTGPGTVSFSVQANAGPSSRSSTITISANGGAVATFTINQLAPASVNYVGYVDHLGCDAIQGWAADRNRLNVSINVEIYDGTTLLQTVNANQSRPDVGNFLGDNGLHGFNIPPPSALRDGNPHSVHVEFETSATELTNSPQTITCTATNYVGYVDHFGCDYIGGWAADRNRLNVSINVQVYDGTTLMTTVLANVSRPDVGGFLGDNGLHGFSISPPAALLDGKAHSVHVKFETSAAELTNSPTNVGPCTAVNYTGWLDHAGCDYIGGWAADRNRLNTSINVQVYDGATLLTTFLANQSRPDVGSYLGDNGLHGFSFATPGVLLDGNAHMVHVKFETSTTELNNSPASLTCATSNPPPTITPPLSPSSVSVGQTATITINGTGFVNTSVTSVKIGPNTRTPSSVASSQQLSVMLQPADVAAAGQVQVTVINAPPGGGTSNAATLTVNTPSGYSSCPQVTTLSGNGTPAYQEGTGSGAEWQQPVGGVVVKDPISGYTSLYIADTANHRIRQIFLSGPNVGASQLVAGNGIQGDVTKPDPKSCSFNLPRAVAAAVDGTGTITTLYIADTGNNRIKTLKPVSGVWQAAAFAGSGIAGSVDGQGSNAQFNLPSGITVGPDGFIYVADYNNQSIRKIDTNANVKGLANTGQGFYPRGITASKVSGKLYFTGNAIAVISVVSTDGSGQTRIAGTGSPGFADGAASSAQFNAPDQIAWGNTGSPEVLFIGDANNNRIRVLNLSTMVVSTFAGTGAAGSADGACNAATFNLPAGVAAGLSSDVYVMDSNSQKVRKLQ